MAERENEVITTLKMPSEDYEGFEEPILIKAVPDNGTGGHVNRKITIPDAVTGGITNVTSLHIPYEFRPTDDTYVFFHIHPTTLHLQMVTRDGEFPRNLATGKIFSLPRVEWMTKLGYAPEACEAHARAQGIWTKLSEIEQRDVDWRNSRKNDGKKDNPSNANVRLVHTFDREKIIEGVAKGEPHLHPVSESYKFRLYDGKGGFDPFWSRESKAQHWPVTGLTKTVPPEVDSVAPFIRESDLAFGFLMYTCSKDTDGVPLLVGDWDSSSPKKEVFPVVHGVGTYLHDVSKRFILHVITLTPFPGNCGETLGSQTAQETLNNRRAMVFKTYF